jgi:SM-20-related protein
MKTHYQQFNAKKFSFRDDPVLVLENFWSEQETAMFREAMAHATWKSLADMPPVAQAFQNCGNWIKAEIGRTEGEKLLEKISLPCIADYIESFPNIKGRHINFNFYSYGVGDCLSTHDDTDEAYAANTQPPPPLRRLALATYFHSEWNPDWGGELIIYNSKKNKEGKQQLEVSQCIAPNPGSLAIFAVPRFHRVCRVDALAGEHKRLSIAGWFMTEHF